MASRRTGDGSLRYSLCDHEISDAMKALLIIFLFGSLLTGCQSAPTARTDSPPVAKQGISEMTPAQARPAVEAAYSQFVDVRTPEEFAAGHAYRTRNIPLDTLSASLDKIDKNEPVYLICRTDNRSRQAAKILAEAGFGQLIVITGGTQAWQASGMPMAK